MWHDGREHQRGRSARGPLLSVQLLALCRCSLKTWSCLQTLSPHSSSVQWSEPYCGCAIIYSDSCVIAVVQVPSVNPEKQHERVTQMYSWHNVAWRTEKVYQRILR